MPTVIRAFIEFLFPFTKKWNQERRYNATMFSEFVAVCFFMHLIVGAVFFYAFWFNVEIDIHFYKIVAPQKKYITQVFKSFGLLTLMLTIFFILPYTIVKYYFYNPIWSSRYLFNQERQNHIMKSQKKIQIFTTVGIAFMLCYSIVFFNSDLIELITRYYLQIYEGLLPLIIGLFAMSYINSLCFVAMPILFVALVFSIKNLFTRGEVK